MYSPHADSARALSWLQQAREPLPFSPLHRLELRTAIRLRVFRGKITREQRRLAFQEVDVDLTDGILAHTAIPWTDASREAEALAALHAEELEVRSFDLLHVGVAVALKATDFLTYDARQGSLAKAARLKVVS